METKKSINAYNLIDTFIETQKHQSEQYKQIQIRKHTYQSKYIFTVKLVS